MEPSSKAWNAYRYPTAREIAKGRAPDDMVFIGSATLQDEAISLLPVRDGAYFGQVQEGLDGQVVNV